MAKSKSKVIDADEINVGPIKITKTGDGGAGIWFGSGKDAPMIALFQTSAQVGIGIYGKGNVGPTNICLLVDQNGDGAIQFANSKGDVAYLTFDQVKKLGSPK